LGGWHLGKHGARDRRELGERGGEARVDAREDVEERGAGVRGQLRGRRRQRAVDDAGVPRRGGRERAHRREEEDALLGPPRAVRSKKVTASRRETRATARPRSHQAAAPSGPPSAAGGTAK